jgi:mercuric ion binding protein
MKKIIVLVVLVLFSNLTFAATSIRAEVKGMVCAFCAKGISKKLNQLDASKEVFVDLKKRTVLVELKEQKNLALDDFRKIINDAGYDVAKVEYVDKTMTELKAELALAGEVTK